MSQKPNSCFLLLSEPVSPRNNRRFPRTCSHNFGHSTFRRWLTRVLVCSGAQLSTVTTKYGYMILSTPLSAQSCLRVTTVSVQRVLTDRLFERHINKGNCYIYCAHLSTVEHSNMNLRLNAERCCVMWLHSYHRSRKPLTCMTVPYVCPYLLVLDS